MDMIYFFIILVVFSFLYYCLYAYSARIANQRRKDFFQKRLKIEHRASLENNAEKSFVSNIILEELSARLNCSKEQIDMSDRFEKELKFEGISFFKLTDLDDMDDFVTKVMEILKITEKTAFEHQILFQKTQTVGDLCHLFYQMYHEQNRLELQ